ncbi:plexin-B-like isoform X3 [Apostichopus japonicus]|uniref:plexin-B-like isoform X3 n=1 Tax=Stichopus japonicus TaxID=307972 RepID=UPI003AB2F2D4
MEFRCRRVAIMIYILCFIQGNSLSFASLDAYNLNSFPVNSETSLNHFTVSEDGSSIYIGGVGRLYRLSRDFSELTSVSTRDNSGNNTNKILSIVPQPVDKLISCGSGLNGTCQLRNLDDLTYTKNETLSSLKVTEDQNPAIGLVVTHPAGVDVNLALYVAQNIRRYQAPISANCLSRSDGICQMDDNRRTNQIAEKVLANFLIRYVASFSYNKYTYFFASQLQDATGIRQPNHIVPKLSRVCQTDSSSSNMDGFTEITLECRGVNNTLYSIVQSSQVVDGQLFAVFVKNNEDESFDLASQSALCIYEMKNLIEKFEDATIDCSCVRDGGSIYSHNNYLSSAQCRLGGAVQCNLLGSILPCTTTQLARYPERKAVLGPIQGEVVFEHSGETFTSILVTKTMVQTASQNVAFIGSQEGHLLKVRFDVANASSGVVYEQLELHSSVLSDTWISNDNESIMVLTERKLIELSILNCSQYQTCDECIKPGSIGGDPYCGWCTLEKRCTRFNDCDGSDDSERWLPFNEDECVTVSASPEHLPVDVTTDRNVFLTVTHLPTNENYFCHFGNFISEAFVSEGNQLICQSPDVATLPNIPVGEDAVEVELSLSSSEYNIKFVSIPYYFFDCNRIKGCVDCSTKWDCNWCVDDFTCSFKRDRPCGDVIMESETCPALQTGDTFIPNGVIREIIFTVQTPTASTSISNKEYECVVVYESTETISNAILSDTNEDNFTVTCEKSQYPYTAEEQTVNASLNLRWKEREVYIDGTNNVVLYKCSVDRPDCSRCLSDITTPSVLMCIWCSSQSLCAVRENCNQGIQKVCTARPQITLIEPTSGPMEGGTMVQIDGTDLGQRFSDIGRVTLADVLCDHGRYEDQYKVGKSVTCMAGSAVVKMGLVSVELTDDRISQGDVMFSYNDPKITSFKPTIGPSAGGTLINIEGIHLNTGQEVEVNIGNQSCHIKTINSTNIQCENVKNVSNSVQKLSVMFDGHHRYASQNFNYRPNPRVASVNPMKAIVSGGNRITVTGERLSIIQTPEMISYCDGKTSSETCEVDSDVRMFCHAPVCDIVIDDVTNNVSIGFLMDGVEELRHWSKGDHLFEYVRDPEYDKFEDDVSDYTGTLTLKGKDLALGSQAKDIKVYVGTEQCTNLSLVTNAVVCIPPSASPPAGDLNGNHTEKRLPFVIVLHANLEVPIGYLNYGSNNIYVVISIAVILIMILLVCFPMMYFLKVKRGDDAIVAQLQTQISKVENQYQQEMKTLFSNLTKRQDIKKTLTSLPTNILCEPSEYIRILLFAGLQIQPCKTSSQCTAFDVNTIRAMDSFGQLLRRNQFIQVVLRTLEDSLIVSFERANIASHLTLCLVLDEKHFILTQLLLRLSKLRIQEIKGESSPNYEDLFESGDSFHEMLLSNWFFISLYDYMDKVGRALQELNYAIKFAIQMGPIDAVTGKSQFTINDKNLLESQVTFHEMIVQVLFKVKQERLVQIRFVSVDTISQVKSKILDHFYMNQIYSKHPLPEYFDLVWHPQKGVSHILTNEENTTDKDGWRKLNLLSNYKINDSDCIELRLKEENKHLDLFSPTEGDCENSADEDYEYVSLLEAAKHLKRTAGNVKKDDVDYLVPDKAAGNVKKDDVDYLVPDKGINSEQTYDYPEQSTGCKLWHLRKVQKTSSPENVDEGNEEEPINDIVLPYLAATKTTIHRYVDEMFNAFMVTNEDKIPLMIKHIFDFFDSQAAQLNNPNLARKWKDGMLPLGLWAFLLNNPTLIYDIPNCSYVKACLQTLVQILHDICQLRDEEIPDDSSPSRKLYSHLLRAYSAKLDKYYSLVQRMKPPTKKSMILENRKVEEKFKHTFDLASTRYQLFHMLAKYRIEIFEALQSDQDCSDHTFANQFWTIFHTLSDV